MMFLHTQEKPWVPKKTSASTLSAKKAPPATDLPTRTQTLQRKPCACGGGCPRCQATAGLEIGGPDDVYEREADAMAGQVMRMEDTGIRATPGLQRKCSACEKEDEEENLVQTKAESPSTPASKEGGEGPAPPIVREVLDSPGRPLDSETRAFFEPRFGHDFSQVRVHTDGKAAESARAIKALAYTLGRQIVFNAGQYAPGHMVGRTVLAHELVHVLQQKRDSASSAKKVQCLRGDPGPMDEMPDEENPHGTEPFPGAVDPTNPSPPPPDPKSCAEKCSDKVRGTGCRDCCVNTCCKGLSKDEALGCRNNCTTVCCIAPCTGTTDNEKDCMECCDNNFSNRKDERCRKVCKSGCSNKFS